ncbi:MAG TPA: hypothetical protein VEG38_08660 [Acidimicrobiia bacterium]|nr:hypothetical protein [Acidimicrobiia bacterium]
MLLTILIAFLCLLAVMAGTLMTSSVNFLVAALVITVVFVTAVAVALQAADNPSESRNDVSR